MKTSIFTFFFFIGLNLTVSAQEELHLDGGCQYYDGTEEEEVYGYKPSDEAQRVVNEIVAKMGIQQRFIVKAANVANAKAAASGNARYILYRTSFIERLKDKSRSNSFFIAYGILAHEIGHHYNNDNFLESDPKRRRDAELAADEFSGYVLYKMGVSFEGALAGIRSLPRGVGTNTHPERDAREEAVATGWKRAEEGKPYSTKNFSPVSETEQAAKQWYDKGVEYQGAKNFSEAITCFDNAIKDKPEFAAAFLRRGSCRDDLKEYNVALKDLNEAIRLRPTNSYAYIIRGIIYLHLNKPEHAISDYNKAIELDSTYSSAYHNRGVAKFRLERWYDAINDYSKAIALDKDNYKAYTNRGNAKLKLGRIQDALADYHLTLQVNPDYANAYYSIGNLYMLDSTKYLDAINAYSQAIKLENNFEEAYFNRGNAYYNLGNSYYKLGNSNYTNLYKRAILDYNEAIKFSRCDPLYFYNRGNAFLMLDRLDDAINDFTQSTKCDNQYAKAYASLGCALLKKDETMQLNKALINLNTALEYDKNLKNAALCKEECLKILTGRK